MAAPAADPWTWKALDEELDRIVQEDTAEERDTKLALIIYGREFETVAQLLQELRPQPGYERWLRMGAELAIQARRRKERLDELVEHNLTRMTTYDSMAIDFEQVQLWQKRLRENSEAFYEAMPDRNWPENVLKEWQVRHEGPDGGLYEHTRRYFTDDTVPIAKFEEMTKVLWGYAPLGILRKEVAEFAENFFNVAQCVSKDEFEHEVQQTALDLSNKLRRLRATGVRVILYLPQEVGRSTLWMTLQMWPYIKDQVDFVDDENVPIQDIHNILVENAAAYFLYIDDAAYSGGQVVNRLEQLPGRGKSQRSFSVIAVPFASSVAVKYWRRKGYNFIARKAHPRMISIGESGKELWDMPSAQQEWREDVQPKTLRIAKVWDAFYFDPKAALVPPHLISDVEVDQIPTIFSHKLPDLISVPLHLFALAPWVEADAATFTATVRRMNLLENCTPDQYEYLYPPKHAYDSLDTDFDQANGNVCPNPIYKRQAYVEADGTEIDSKASIIATLDRAEEEEEEAVAGKEEEE